MSRIITDSRGRKITLRKIGVLETLKLYKALGPDLSINSAYVSAASIAAAAAMIDDIPLPFPSSEAGVELLLERLDDDGIAAIIETLPKSSLEKTVTEAGN